MTKHQSMALRKLSAGLQDSYTVTVSRKEARLVLSTLQGERSKESAIRVKSLKLRCPRVESRGSPYFLLLALYAS